MGDSKLSGHEVVCRVVGIKLQQMRRSLVPCWSWLCVLLLVRATSAATSCSGGEFLVNRACLPCMEGFQCPGGTSGPSKCTSGNYAGASASSCTPCVQASGEYCPFAGMGAPLTCPAGYSLSGNTKTCSGCAAGSECPDSATTTSCSAGSAGFGFASACLDCSTSPYGCSGSSAPFCEVTKFTSAGTCTNCGNGNECLDRKSQANCATGEYSRPGNDVYACHPCPAGSKCTSPSSAPTACSAGQKQSADGTNCQVCTGDCPDPQMDYDYSCPFGMYSDAGQCKNCPAGSDCTSGSPLAVSTGSFSPLGYSGTYVCAPEAVCGANGGDYNSCAPGQKFNVGSNACDDCTDFNLYCPDGISEIGLSYMAVGDDTTFRFAKDANSWWTGSAFSVESAVDDIFSPLLYKSSYQRGIFQIDSQECLMRTPSFKKKVNGNSVEDCDGTVCFFGQERAAHDSEIALSDYSPVEFITHTGAYVFPSGGAYYLQCQPDRVPTKNNNAECVYCENTANERDRFRCDMRQRVVSVNEIDDIALECAFGSEEAIDYTDVCTPQRKVIPTCHNGANYFDASILTVTADTDDRLTRTTTGVACQFYDNFSSVGVQNTRYTTDDICLAGEYSATGMGHCSVNFFGFLNQRQTYESGSSAENTDACPDGNVCNVYWEDEEGYKQIENECPPGYQGLKDGGAGLDHACRVLEQGQYDTDQYEGILSCVAGSYCPARGRYDSVFCPGGFEATGASTKDRTLCQPCVSKVCEEGQEVAGLDTTKYLLGGPAGKVASPLGKSWNGGTSQATVANSFRNEAELADTVCPNGTDQPDTSVSGMLGCQRCADNKVCTLGGATQTDCTDQICLVGGGGQACDQGRSTGSTGLPSQLHCDLVAAGSSCTAGYFCPLGSTWSQMFACSPGTKSAADAGSYADCSACANGEHCDFATETPASCPSSFYCVAGDKLLCDEGQGTTAADQGTCAVCDSNKFCEHWENRDAGTARSCPVSQHNDGATSTNGKCVDLAEHKVANAGTGAAEAPPNGRTAYAGTQVPCDDGFQCLNASGVKEACAAGYRCSIDESGTDYRAACDASEDCVAGTAAPAKCTPGKYGTTTSTVCPDVAGTKYQLGDGVEQDCPQRFFCPGGSTTGQQVCDDSKTSTVGGATLTGDCTDCPTGKYCIDQTERDCTVAGFTCGVGQSEPIRCIAGTFKTTAGTDACDQCTQGYYCPYAGMGAVDQDYTCAAGYYCPEGASSKRQEECPEGNFCVAQAATPTPCDAGTYNPNTGGTSTNDCHSCPKGKACVGTGNTGVGGDCEAGYFCTGGADTTQQHTTQAGYYSQAGAIMQLPCLHGTFSAATNAGTCDPCTAGKYCPAAQVSVPTDCDPGHYCEEGSINPTPCPFGKYRLNSLGTLEGDCTDCDSGKFCGDYALTAITGTCAAGFYCTTKARVEKPVTVSAGEYGICPEGNYCEAGQQPATCDAGTFRSATGGKVKADDCWQCLEGHKCETAGMTTMDASTMCDNGYRCTEGADAQVACTTDHFYCPQPTAVELACPLGKQRIHSDPATWDCEDCEQGYYCALGVKTVCPAGYYCPTGVSAPIPCEPGKYNDQTQQHDPAACVTCTKGNACPYSGVAAVIPCDAQFYCLAGSIYEKPVEVAYGGLIRRGYYVDASKDEVLCDQGYVCNRMGTTDAADAAVLSKCKDGYFCDFANVAVIVTAPSVYADDGGNICPTGSSCFEGVKTLCTAGSYSPSLGAKTCLTCQLGKVCDAGATAPLDECPSGHYCQAGTQKDGGGTINSTECQAGYQCPASAHEEIVCPAGYYQPSAGQDSCIICPAGSFCPPTRAAIINHTPCLAGHKCETQGLTHPTPCLPGTYQKNTGQSDCLPCQANFYCPESKTSTDGEACVAGYYCPEGSKDLSLVCPTGYYCPASSPAPVPCTAGNYCAQEGLGAVSGPCLKGYICNAGTNAIGGSKVPNPTDGTLGYICPAGHFCAAGVTPEQECLAGTYWDGVGAGESTDCKACPPGFICTTTQLIDPTTACPEGKYCVGDTQTDCDAGHYCPANSHEQLKCQPGTYQPSTGQGSCITCEAGSYCYWNDADGDGDPTTLGGTEVTQKLDCPAGFFCPLGSAFYAHNPCPVGTYSAATNLQDEQSCTSCDAGSYCDRVGQNAVTGPCADGYICATGSTEKAPRNAFCTQNFYCVGGVTTECPAGTFTHGEGARSQDECIKCSPGWVCPNHHSGKQKCPAGSYCAAGLSDPAAEPVSCDTGHYCAEGAYVQLKCPIGTFNANTGQTTCTSCPASELCDTEGLTSTNTCPADFVCAAGSARAQTCAEGTYESGGACVACDAGKYCWAKGVASNKQGDCAPGHVCQGSSWAKYPYYAGALNPQFSSFTTYNGRAYLGYFTDADTSSNQICTAGTYQNSYGAAACKPCPSGSYCASNGIGIEPPDCARGTVCPDSATSSTDGSCPANKYCPDGAVVGLLCPDGQEPNAAQTGCQKCAKGSYCHIDSSTDAIVLTTCIPGNVCQLTGLSYEPKCPAGTYESAGSCVACDAGKFCVDGTLSGDCISGSICSGGSSSPAPSSGAGGYSCPKNKFCLAADVTEQDCPSQTFRTTEGGQQQSDCSECLPGYICLEGLSEPISCPEGYYCVLGEDQAQPCPVGSYSNTKLLSNRAECLTCPSGFYCDEVALLSPKSCPVASFCDANSVEPDICPEGKFRGSTEARSVVQCLTCLSGNYCPTGSVDPTPCSGSFYCPRGSTDVQTLCPAGHYCSDQTGWLAYDCPANNYCPVGSLEPTPCVDGQSCPPNSEYYTVCGLGQYTEFNHLLGYYTCIDCPVGTYSSIMDAASCLPCPAGYYCHGGTPKKYPKVVASDKGEDCPIGYYCEEGTTTPTPCPRGTYRSETNGASSADCLNCPAGSYNRFTGQQECKECGPDATSLDGAFTCSCRGRFRAFQYSDTSCRCEPGTRFIDDFGDERSEESSPHNCEPIVLTRCEGEQVRTLDGRCVNKYDCTSACNGGEGVRADETGECECQTQASLDSYCDDNCRFFAEGSTMPTATDSQSQIYLDVKDPASGAVTSTQTFDIASSFNFIGKLVCEVNTDKSCAVRHCQHEADGKVFGSYNPSSKLHTAAQAARLLQSQQSDKNRELQTTTGSVANPVICLNLGDGMLFEINSPDHYPVYLKDSLINSNPAFDFGQFKDLEIRMQGLQDPDPTVDDSFAQPYYFGFSFTEAGNYVFADAADSDQQSLIAVMAENERCLDPENYIMPREPNALERLGIGFRGNIYLEADYLMIGVIFGAFVFTLILIIGACKNFTSQPWSVKATSKGGYRQRQREYAGYEALELRREFYEEMAGVWQERQRAETAMAETENVLWQQEESEMEEVNMDVLPDLERKVRRVMRKMEKAQDKKQRRREELVEQLAGLEERLAELRLMNERLISEEMARKDGVALLALDKPALERKQDNEELSRLKREQEQREEQQRREVQEMVTGLKKKREDLSHAISEHSGLDELQRNKLLLELEQQQKKMQDELLSEKEKQEVEFRRLLRARADHQKARKGKLKHLADKISKADAQGVDALRDLTREAVESLDAGVVSEIARQVDKEKEEALAKIEEEARRRLEEAGHLVGEQEGALAEAERKVKAERDLQRVQLMKKLEARKRKLYFAAVKDQAMAEADEDQSVQALLGELLGEAQLVEVRQQAAANRDELEATKQQHRKDFKDMMKKHKDTEKRQEAVLEDRLDDELEREQERAEERLKRAKQEVEAKKENLKRQLRYVTRDDEREALMQQLQAHTAEMADLIHSEKDAQKNLLAEKRKERKRKKQEMAQSVRERQEHEQLERTAEHVRRESEKQRALNYEEIEAILAKLVKKMADQREMQAMGVELKEREVTLEDVVEVFDKLTAQKMLEELSFLLAKQFNSKEGALNSQLRQQVERKLADSEELKEELAERLAALEQEGERAGWTEAQLKEKQDAALLEVARQTQEKDVQFANQFKEREAALLKDMEREHTDELMDLREKQIKGKLTLFRKVLGPLGVGGSLEDDLAAQLQQYQLEKSDDYNRSAANIDAQKKALEEELERELAQRYSNYEEMLARQKEDERMLRAKRENLQKLIDEKKVKFKKRLEEGVEVSAFQQEEIMRQHEAELEAISGAIEQERIRQMQFFKAQMERKKRLRDYQDEKRKMRVAHFLNDLNQNPEAVMLATGSGGIFLKDPSDRNYRALLQQWVDRIKHKQQERLAVSTLFDAPRQFVSALNLKRIIERTKQLERQVKALLKAEDRNIFL